MSTAPRKPPTRAEWFGVLPDLSPREGARRIVRGACAGLVAVVAGVAVGAAIGSDAGQIAGAVVGCVIGLTGSLWAVVAGLQVGWSIGPDGVTEHRLPFWRRTVARHDLDSLELGPGGLVLRGRAADLALGSGQPRWRRAARLCADALGLEVDLSEPSAVMDEAALVALLGCPVPVDLPSGTVDPGCLVGLAAGFLLALLAGGFVQPWLLLLALVYGWVPVLIFWASRRVARRAVVTAAGVELHYLFRRLFAPWSQIRAIRRTGSYIVLETDVGDLSFIGRPRSAPILDGIERVLAARDEGLALPRLGEVPAGALSAVRGADQPVERGLSRGQL